LSEDAPKIKVFASDDNLKALGELLSNDSSRNIIYNLMTKEMYTNEIATKLDMRVSLVIHHLKKLEDLGLLEITEKKIKRKGIEHRFFQIKSNIFVVLDNTVDEIQEKGFLKNIFKDGIKFAAIGITSLTSWLLLYDPPSSVTSQTSEPYSVAETLLIPLSIIIIGLIIERIFYQFKKKGGDD